MRRTSPLSVPGGRRPTPGPPWMAVLVLLLLAAGPLAAAKARMYRGPERPNSEVGILTCPMGDLRILEIDEEPLRMSGFSARFQRDGCGGVGNKIHVLPGTHSVTVLVPPVLTRLGDGRICAETRWATVEFAAEAGHQYRLRQVAATGVATWEFRLSRLHELPGGEWEVLEDRIVTAGPAEPLFVVIDKGSGQRVGAPVKPAPWLQVASRLYSPDDGSGGARGGIAKRFTGLAEPTLTVRNHCEIPQFIFLDGSFLGVVEVNGSGTFAVSVGPHQVLVADSRDPADHPVAERQAFEAGYRYVFLVTQGG